MWKITFFAAKAKVPKIEIPRCTTASFKCTFEEKQKWTEAHENDKNFLYPLINDLT